MIETKIEKQIQTRPSAMGPTSFKLWVMKNMKSKQPLILPNFYSTQHIELISIQI